MVAFAPNDDNDRPPEHILEWCRNLVRIMHDGAVWGIPRSGTTFRIDKKNQQLVLVIAGEDDGADFIATKHVFAYIGWEVVKESEPPSEQPAQN